MTSILENELVRRYFGEVDSRSKERRHNWAMADSILRAMQEPIKVGERYLSKNASSDSFFDLMAASEFGDGFHPYQLRLPTRFQLSSEKMNVTDMPDFEWCGYTQNQLRSMRDFAICHGWQETQPPPTPEEVRQGTSGGIYKSSEPYTCTKHMITGCQFCKPHSPNKFDEAVKRSFEEDNIIEPGKVFEKPAEPRKCRDAGIAGHHAARNCDCLCCKPAAPDPAIEAKINTICDEIARCWVNREFVSASHQLRELITLARRSDR